MAEVSEAKPRERPLSPHLQIYRWPATMLTSILHRASGIALAGGAILVTGWLAAAAMGSDTFGMIHEILAAWYGQVVLFGFALALNYHFLNGIRHLIWDAGSGFNLRTARIASWSILAGSFVLTLIVWIAAYWIGAGARG
jgi:succinate dehydrogenase / fumarate reductase, cytochrome b subunit